MQFINGQIIRIDNYPQRNTNSQLAHEKILTIISHGGVQINTRVRYLFTPMRMTGLRNIIIAITGVGEGVEKGEPSYTKGGNAEWCILCRKHFHSSLKG